jgi:arylformamidase
MQISDGADANASKLTMDVHVGTHVDAPLHFVDDGENLEAVGLDPFLGPAQVIDLRGTKRIGAADLDAAGVDDETARLLIRAQPNALWFTEPFDADFPALTADGASWIADRSMRLVGIDYLSIQRFEDGPETHQILLRGGTCILEGLDLSATDPGHYDLICLPIRLLEAEAAPARALIRSSI